MNQLLLFKKNFCYYFSGMNTTDSICYSSASDAGAKPSPFKDLLNEIKNHKGDNNYKVELPAGA